MYCFSLFLTSTLTGLSLARHTGVTENGKAFAARDSMASTSTPLLASTLGPSTSATAGNALSVVSGAASMLLSLVTTTATTTMAGTPSPTPTGITGISAVPANSISSSGAAMPKPTHKIEIGADGQARFQPDSVDAAVGDVLLFSFRALNHSLTQSSLEQPCVASHGFDSGFNQYNAADSHDISVAFTVNTAAPQWFFCGQIDEFSHCEQGMVFAVNPGDKMNQFLLNAAASTSTATASTTKSITSSVSMPTGPTTTSSSSTSTTSTLRSSLGAATISTAASTGLSVTSLSPATPFVTNPTAMVTTVVGVQTSTSVDSVDPMPATSTLSSIKSSPPTTGTVPMTLSTTTMSFATTTLSGGPFKRVRKNKREDLRGLHFLRG